MFMGRSYLISGPGITIHGIAAMPKGLRSLYLACVAELAVHLIPSSHDTSRSPRNKKRHSSFPALQTLPPVTECRDSLPQRTCRRDSPQRRVHVVHHSHRQGSLAKYP
jgi:hypothetical protein